MKRPKSTSDTPTEPCLHFRCAWCEKTMRAMSVASGQEVNYGMCRTCLDGELNRLSREDALTALPARTSDESAVWTAAV